MTFEWVYLNLLPFIGVITVIVFFHELGHYLAAKYNGVKVEAFSIGFGPELFGFNDKSGTRWKFSLLPMGGYVRMFSDANIASQPDAKTASKMTKAEKSVSLFHKTVWQRIQVSAAGPIGNYVLSIVILAVLYSFSGQAVPADTAKLGFVQPNSPAAIAGIMTDDEVVRVNGQTVETFEQMTAIVRANPDNALSFGVMRDGREVNLTVTPRKIEEAGKPVGQIGVGLGAELVKRSLLTSWWYATKDVTRMTWLTLKAVGQIINGTRSSGELTGPIGIAQKTGEFAVTNVPNFMWFIAFLSLNLGLINLFPIPMLDGGHLLFYFIELFRGRPVSEKSQEIGFRIGFTLVIGLMLLVTWNDLVRLDVIKRITSLFGF